MAKSYSKIRRTKEISRSLENSSSFRNMFNINGVLFLWKLYLFEFIESINQIVNLPPCIYVRYRLGNRSVCVFCYAIDAFYRAYQLRQPNTIARRDRQVKIDICIDFLCVAVPICVLWFAYHIPISIPEMIQITVWPTLCLFSKLRSILREIIRVRTDNAILLEQTGYQRKRTEIEKCFFAYQTC